MVKDLKINDIKKLYPRRAADSHKGMNGRVMVVGGSMEYTGAPLLSALGALYGGADLVHVFVPESNFDVCRSMYPDLIVHSFPGEFLDMKTITPVVEFAKKCDSILIGPGLGEREETRNALATIVKSLSMPTVLDSNAIQVLKRIKEVPKQQIVITPHHNEFETLTGKDIKISGSLSNKVVLLRTLATDLKINILLKGPEDLIVSDEGEVLKNTTGNPGMTVGGSGDVLSGFVASLIAQGATPFAACKIGAHLFGKVGDDLAKAKGYNFSATDLAMEIPYAARNVTL